MTLVLAALPAGYQITFPPLQQLLEMSAGNLSTHLRTLEDYTAALHLLLTPPIDQPGG